MGFICLYPHRWYSWIIIDVSTNLYNLCAISSATGLNSPLTEWRWKVVPVVQIGAQIGRFLGEKAVMA